MPSTRPLSLSEEELGRGLVCASSGNHAQGVAYAAHKLGAQAVIVMPTNANPVKLAGVQRWGGQVELVGTLSSQREERAAQLVREQGMVEIHPYADPFVAAGQGTLALEVLEDLPDASLIAAPIGGGGLISGIATAVKGPRPRYALWGVERQARPGTPEAGRRAAPSSWSPSRPSPTAPAPTTPTRTTSPSSRPGWTSCIPWRTAGSRRPCAFWMTAAKVIAEPSSVLPVAAALCGALPCPAGGQGGVRPVRRQRRSGSVGPAAGLTALRSVTLSQKARRSCAMLNIPSKGRGGAAGCAMTSSFWGRPAGLSAAVAARGRNKSVLVVGNRWQDSPWPGPSGWTTTWACPASPAWSFWSSSA